MCIQTPGTSVKIKSMNNLTNILQSDICDKFEIFLSYGINICSVLSCVCVYVCVYVCA